MQQVPEEIYRVLENEEEIKSDGSKVPESLEEFLAEIKDSQSDAKIFALKLKSMVCENLIRTTLFL